MTVANIQFDILSRLLISDALCLAADCKLDICYKHGA